MKRIACSIGLAGLLGTLALTSGCASGLNAACNAIAAEAAALATAPAPTASQPTVQVECEIIDNGKTLSHPTMRVVSGQSASCEVGGGQVLPGQEMSDGVQVHVRPIAHGDAISIKGEVSVARFDKCLSTRSPDASWHLQRGHRWVFHIHSTDPHRWYATPAMVDGLQVRLRAMRLPE